MRWEYRASALALCLIAAACDKRTSGTGPATNETAPNEAANSVEPFPEADNAAASNAAAEQTKSILRPDVVPPLPKLPELEPIHAVIDFGASGLKLDDAGQKAIDALIEPMTKLGGAVILRGHSDSHGSDGDNVVASRIRAEKVRDYLIGKGITKDRIQLIALGEARPIAPNARPDGSDDPDGRARNRRVELDAQPKTSPAEIPPPK
jgi:OOP family OmpA-OmpF porin